MVSTVSLNTFHHRLGHSSDEVTCNSVNVPLVYSSASYYKNLPPHVNDAHMEKVRDFSKFTGFRVLYFLKFKSQVFDYFKLYETQLTRETNHHVQSFRSENGSEFTSEEFSRFLEKEGIRHETSTPYSPQQKGVAEREKRTVH